MRAGYSFSGWYTEDGQRVTTSTAFSGDSVIRARWFSLSSNGSSDTYPVKVEDTEHGTVTASPKAAYQGNTITLTVTPRSGL